MFIYTSNKQFKKKLRKAILFIIATKIIKYLEINLTKDLKDAYTENYKSLPKKIEDPSKRKKHTTFMDRIT